MSVKNFCTVLCFIAVLSLVPAYCADINLLTNPGFEEETTGWSGRGCAMSLSTNSHSGSHSVLANNRSATWQGISQPLLGKVKSGATYQVTAWVKVANTTSDNVYITAEQADSSGSKYVRIVTGKGSDSEWTELSGTFKPEVVGKLFALNIFFEGPAAGIDLYVDDVNVFGPLAEPPPPINPNATGIVDPAIRHQVIEGFGASGGYHADWLSEHPQKTKLYNLLFKQLNLNLYRIRNTYYMDSDQTDDTTKIIHSAEHILGHPMKIMVACWTPPAYLKSNNNIVAGTLKKDSSGNYMYNDFAKWWLDSLTDFSNHNINIDYLSIQNEPDIVTRYESCKIIATEDANWAGYNLALDATYKQLHARMQDKMPKLVVPDTMGFGNSRAYIDAIIDKEQVYGYAHHLYSDGIGGYEIPESYVMALQNYAAQYGPKPLYQTEYSRNSNFQRAGFNDAIYTAWHMHNCLVYENLRAYYYWDLFWNQDERGLISLASPKGSSGYTINPTYYAFKQFSAFTGENWQRIEASTDSEPLKISAYISPDNNKMSVIIINTSDVNIELTLSLNNFSIASGSVYRTSQTENCVFVRDFEKSQPLPLPAKSITTVALTDILL